MYGVGFQSSDLFSQAWAGFFNRLIPIDHVVVGQGLRDTTEEIDSVSELQDMCLVRRSVFDICSGNSAAVDLDVIHESREEFPKNLFVFRVLELAGYFACQRIELH